MNQPHQLSPGARFARPLVNIDDISISDDAGIVVGIIMSLSDVRQNNPFREGTKSFSVRDIEARHDIEIAVRALMKRILEHK